jgi:hypothetical protein
MPRPNPAPHGLHTTGTGHEIPYVDFDGSRRLLACLPPRPGAPRAPRWAANMPMVPRDQWREVNNRGLGVKIKDQNGYSSCVGNGSVGALECARALSGAKYVELSAAFTYAQINGGQDAGAIISDAMDELSKTGTCTAAEVPESMIYRRSIPQSAYATAARFRISEAYHAGTFDEIMSGIMLGYIAVFGLYVGGDFPNLDSNGIAPAHPNRQGNHCVHADGARMVNGVWVLDSVNSWGTQYGDGGRMGLVAAHFQGQDPDAFLIQAATEDPQEPDEPPVIT